VLAPRSDRPASGSSVPVARTINILIGGWRRTRTSPPACTTSKSRSVSYVAARATKRERRSSACFHRRCRECLCNGWTSVGPRSLLRFVHADHLGRIDHSRCILAVAEVAARRPSANGRVLNSQHALAAKRMPASNPLRSALRGRIVRARMWRLHRWLSDAVLLGGRSRCGAVSLGDIARVWLPAIVRRQTRC
jgi:hypothetical protein